MVGVAVLVIIGVDVVVPFLKLTVAAYLIRIQIVYLVLPFGYRSFVCAENFGGLYCLREHLESHGIGVGGAKVAGAVFGRV